MDAAHYFNYYSKFSHIVEWLSSQLDAIAISFGQLSRVVASSPSRTRTCPQLWQIFALHLNKLQKILSLVAN